MPLAGTDRKCGLMRQSVKMCVWLGQADCYRNQDRVLWTPSEATSARHRADIALRYWTQRANLSQLYRSRSPPMNVVEPLHLIFCRWRPEVSLVVPSITLRRPLITLQLGGVATSCRREVYCSMPSSVAAACWWQDWTKGLPRSSGSTRSPSTWRPPAAAFDRHDGARIVLVPCLAALHRPSASWASAQR